MDQRDKLVACEAYITMIIESTKMNAKHRSKFSRLLAIAGILIPIMLVTKIYFNGLRNLISLDLINHLAGSATLYAPDFDVKNRMEALNACSDCGEFLGRVFVFMGDKDHARQRFAQSSVLPLSKEWLLALGINATVSGKYDIAHQALGIYIDLNPHDAEGYVRQGLAFRYQGDREKARELYVQAMRTDPKYATRMYFLIGQTYLDINQVLNGFEAIQEALRRDKEDHSLDITERMAANYWLGVGYLYQNNLVMAASYLKRAIELQSQVNGQVEWIACGSKLALGVVLHRQEHIFEATTVLNEVIDGCSNRVSEVIAAEAELSTIGK